jgi:hypothetical protein
VAVIRTSLLQEHSTLGDYDGNIAVYIALAILIDKRDGDVGIRDALAKRDAEYPLRPGLCDS